MPLPRRSRSTRRGTPFRTRDSVFTVNKTVEPPFGNHHRFRSGLAFYANRSTSDLNPSVMKKLNLTSSAARQGRVNPMIANRKPPAASRKSSKDLPMTGRTCSSDEDTTGKDTIIPSAEEATAHGSRVGLQVELLKIHLPAYFLYSLKPYSNRLCSANSRSTSPGRMRTKSRIPAPAEATKAHRDPSPRASGKRDVRVTGAPVFPFYRYVGR